MKLNQFTRLAVGVAAASSVMGAQVATAQTPAPAQPGVNLLTNPGHEHPGAYFGGRGELNVTWNWTPFWEEPPPGTDLRDQNYRTPEFRPPFARDYPYRVNSGGGSDRWFNYFALNKAAGIMQVVEGLQAGQRLRYSAWVQLWSSNDNDPAIPPKSTRDGNMQIRACIQQDGGPRNMVSPELVCSPWYQPYDKWYQISVDAVAKGPKVLALVQSRASIPVEHNDAYVDDSCLEILSGSGICLGQGFVPTGWSKGVAQQSAPAPLAPPDAGPAASKPATASAPSAVASAPAASAPTASAPAVAGQAPRLQDYKTYDEYLTAYYAYVRAPRPASTGTAASTSTATSTGTAASAGAASTVSNVAAGLNIRSGPSTGASIIGVLPQGASVEVTGKTADGLWYRVNSTSGTGYVFAALTTPNAAAQAASVVQ
ncbi:MAG: SH3 domain-containing protein [Anaerolineae bacterium]|nr:SH3 domain-containing protein [Anaerolineae bacterium]